MTTEGQNYIGTVKTGSLWYFPPGQPHSIQATDDDPAGCEFLLVFNDGSFSEDSTFLVSLRISRNRMRMLTNCL